MQICEGGFVRATSSDFGPRWGLASFKDISAAGARTPIASAYNARVDRLNAIRLLQALVAAGANIRAPMDSAWVDKIAVRDVSLHGTELASAIAYAEGERWLTDSPREGWIYLTSTGEAVAKAKLP